MRFVYYCLFPAILLLVARLSHAQTGEGLIQDARGRYLFSHTASAPGVEKAEIYRRLRSFVIEDLNASDTRITWDESRNDSASTIAYIELGDGPEMRNQVVSCKAHLDFTDGAATLVLSGFLYNGQRVDSAVSYARSLHRMGPVPLSAQAYALDALRETLRQLMLKMDALAVSNAKAVRTTR